MNVFFFLVVVTFSQSHSTSKADSLFKAKKYTQSLEIYQSLLQDGKYSPAMLLKMAYIQEGLGHIGQSIYCLRLYQSATDDQQAMEKIQELAAKFNLTGYDQSDADLFYKWIDKNMIALEIIFILLILILTYISFVLKRKKKPAYFVLALSGIFILGVLYLNNFVSISSVITRDNRVYLMEGPSAGSSVEGILSDGNQLQVVGKEDVWLKVKWMDKNVFVKENAVLRIAL